MQLQQPQQPGAWLFHDAIGAPGIHVQVVDDADVLCARFTDDEGGEALVPVVDMAGTWLPA